MRNNEREMHIECAKAKKMKTKDLHKKRQYFVFYFKETVTLKFSNVTDYKHAQAIN